MVSADTLDSAPAFTYVTQMAKLVDKQVVGLPLLLMALFPRIIYCIKCRLDMDGGAVVPLAGLTKKKAAIGGAYLLNSIMHEEEPQTTSARVLLKE